MLILEILCRFEYLVCLFFRVLKQILETNASVWQILPLREYTLSILWNVQRARVLWSLLELLSLAALKATLAFSSDFFYLSKLCQQIFSGKFFYSIVAFFLYETVWKAHLRRWQCLIVLVRILYHENLSDI